MGIFVKVGIKLPETITEEELISILKATKLKHHRIAFALGFYQGMRISEIVNLKKENIDKSQRIIRIKDAKGHKDRNLPIAPQVFRGLTSIPIHCGIRALQIAFKKKGKEVLNRDLHFHLLRHSGATHYLKKGWNIREVQQFLGHSRLETTQIYTHVSPQDLMEKMWG